MNKETITTTVLRTGSCLVLDFYRRTAFAVVREDERFMWRYVGKNVLVSLAREGIEREGFTARLGSQPSSMMLDHGPRAARLLSIARGE